MDKGINRYLKAGLTALVLGGISQAASAVQIDLLVLYDDASASQLKGEPKVVMKSWQDQINTMYKNSQVDLQLRIVGVEKNNESGSNMDQVLGRIRTSSTVSQIRERVGADFVTQLHQTGNCGIGYLAVDAGWAYNVLGATCGPAALAHELGHNMGLNHSRAQGDTSGTKYRYGLGHGVNGAFGTLMTYEWYYRASKMSVFSNPRIQCRGYPCGVAEGQSGEADAAKAINNVKASLANFRPTKVANGGSDPAPTNPTTPDPQEPTTPNPNPGTTVKDGRYTLKVASSGRCLDIYRSGWGFNNAVEWNCTQAANQQWDITSVGDGFVTLKGASTQACLNVTWSSNQSGANVIQWSCANNRASQQWKVVPKGNKYQIVARHSGLCLDAPSNSNGGSVVQATCSDAASQRFNLSAM